MYGINIHAKFLFKPNPEAFTFKVLDKNIARSMKLFYTMNDDGIIDVYGFPDTKFRKNKVYNINIYSNVNCSYGWEFCD